MKPLGIAVQCVAGVLALSTLFLFGSLYMDMTPTLASTPRRPFDTEMARRMVSIGLWSSMLLVLTQVLLVYLYVVKDSRR